MSEVYTPHAEPVPESQEQTEQLRDPLDPQLVLDLVNDAYHTAGNYHEALAAVALDLRLPHGWSADLP